MRIPALFLALGLAVAAPAVSAPTGAPISEVTVTIGPKLADKAKDYGDRELNFLATELKKDAERALSRTGRLQPGGGRIELVINDAKPNRPTMEQMTRKPGLSLQSIAIGGASIEGKEVQPNGDSRAMAYSWYETDIRNAKASTTWSDAERTFDVFIRRYVAE
jgi:hypothetical protein